MLSWYNPSSLPRLRERRTSAGIGIRSLGRTEAWASYDFRVPPRVGMGLSLVYRGDPFIGGLYDGYYDGGEVVEERPLDNAAYTALSLKIGVGYLATRQLSFGGAVSVNHQSLPTTPNDHGAVAHTSVTSIGAIDLAASYRVSQTLTLAAMIRNLLSRNTWHIYSDEGFSPTVEESVPPIFAIASSHKIKLSDRDFIWNAETQFFLFDGGDDLRFTDHPEISLAVGAEWMFSDMITLRAGISDINLSADLFTGDHNYRDSFAPRFALGFSYALAKLGDRARVNYAIKTCPAWLGVDQQIDLTVSF